AGRAYGVRKPPPLGIVRRYAPARGDLPCPSARRKHPLDGRTVRCTRRAHPRAHEPAPAEPVDGGSADGRDGDAQHLGGRGHVRPRDRSLAPPGPLRLRAGDQPATAANARPARLARIRALPAAITRGDRGSAGSRRDSFMTNRLAQIAYPTAVLVAALALW